MKILVAALIALITSSTLAQADAGKGYANPKSLYMKCELATIYGNTNDSWGITIKGLDIAFWDNSSWSIGKYAGVGYDNTISTSDRSYGDGRFFVYEGPKDDSWKLIIGPTYLMEGNQVDKRVPHIYGKLKVPGKMKEQIMECKTISKKEAQDDFDMARD